MLSENVIFEICSFLDLRSLIRMTKVNRKCRKVALRPEFYRKEFLRVFEIELDFNPGNEECRNWVYIGWDLGKCILSLKNNPCMELLEWVIQQLASPQIPLPKLRKESIIFGTVFQDIFAYFYSENCESKPNSIQNFEIIETANINNSHILSVKNSFFTDFTQLIKTYCRGICQRLNETQELLSSYLDHWEKYSFSSQSILDDFLTFFPSTTPEIFNFFIHLPKLLAQIWTHEVYYPLRFQLNEQFLGYFIKSISINKQEKILCQRFFEALVDLSVNEVTVHYKDHSKVELQGPLNAFEEYFLSSYCSIRKQAGKEEELEAILFVFYGGTAKRMLEKCWNSEEVGKIVENLQMRDYLIEHKNRKLDFWKAEKVEKTVHFLQPMKYVI